MSGDDQVNGHRFDDRARDSLDESGLDEETRRGAVEAAERFFGAVGEHDLRGFWDQMSEGARAYVLELALDRGMDFDLNSRLRQGTATDEEFDTYLDELLEGIKKDLRGLDLQRLAFEAAPEPDVPGKVRVTYSTRMDAMLGDVQPTLPAGSLVMTEEDGEWKVDRLIPTPG